jgi:hypothetical protein
MRLIAWQAGRPEVDLRIDDPHGLLFRREADPARGHKPVHLCGGRTSPPRYVQHRPGTRDAVPDLSLSPQHKFRRNIIGRSRIRRESLFRRGILPTAATAAVSARGAPPPNPVAAVVPPPPKRWRKQKGPRAGCRRSLQAKANPAPSGEHALCSRGPRPSTQAAGKRSASCRYPRRTFAAPVPPDVGRFFSGGWRNVLHLALSYGNGA